LSRSQEFMVVHPATLPRRPTSPVMGGRPAAGPDNAWGTHGTDKSAPGMAGTMGARPPRFEEYTGSLYADSCLSPVGLGLGAIRNRTAEATATP
jgi:hypothetical protein